MLWALLGVLYCIDFGMVWYLRGSFNLPVMVVTVWLIPLLLTGIVSYYVGRWRIAGRMVTLLLNITMCLVLCGMTILLTMDILDTTTIVRLTDEAVRLGLSPSITFFSNMTAILIAIVFVFVTVLATFFGVRRAEHRIYLHSD
jgi:hypothetical protein